MQIEAPVIPEPTDRVRLNFWVSGQAHRGFQYLAKLDGRSVSDLVREAMRDYLNKHEARLEGDR